MLICLKHLFCEKGERDDKSAAFKSQHYGLFPLVLVSLLSEKSERLHLKTSVRMQIRKPHLTEERYKEL
jgi:hypothetical protein